MRLFRKKLAPKHVLCTECNTSLVVSPRAMSMTCPACFRRVILEDITVRSYLGALRVATAGTLHVLRTGTVIAGDVRAADLRVDGTVRGRVEVLGHAALGPHAVVQGRLQARSLHRDPGARVEGELVIEEGDDGPGA